MRRSWPKCGELIIRGRQFGQADLVLIRKLIARHPTWGRTRVSQEICKILDWRQENSALKERACRVALLRLEGLGLLELPKKKIDRGGRPPTVFPDPVPHGQMINAMPISVTVRLVGNQAESRLWNALIAHHHYIGLATPVGRLLRYLVYADDMLVSAISFSEAAWAVDARDAALQEIGIDQIRIRDVTISNNRFLILPFVQVKNLASRILSLATRTAAMDWSERYQVCPLIAETFVDPSRFHGTCYSAANWTHVGMTKGFSKCGATHASTNSPKMVFLVGLCAKIQRSLIQNSTTRKMQRAA